MMSVQTKMERLLKDFGYRMAGDTLICCGIKGWSSDMVVGRFKSLYEAVDYLCPIIRDDEYTERFTNLSPD